MSKDRPLRINGQEGFEAVVIPSAEEMIAKLTGAGILGTAPECDTFYFSFIDKLAGRTKRAEGINLAWDLSLYDTVKEYPPQFITALNATYDGAIDALISDRKVAQEAKEVRKFVLGLVAKTRKNPQSQTT